MDEHIRYAMDVVGKDPMAVFLSIKVEEVRRAYARLSLRIGSNYLNALGRAHGIAISALIDQALFGNIVTFKNANHVSRY
ncbi:MAG: hypothetical protein GY864_10880 [Desulfobacterales bacterium]|nr:hypothetical protein [Desulfobacterales bacterium]